MEIPSTFTPRDCAPGQAPPPMDLPIVGNLNTYVAGSPPHVSFRPVAAGWHLAAKGTPDVAAPPGAEVSATWDLRG